MAQQADRLRLGRAALADGLVRPGPAGRARRRGRRGVRSARRRRRRQDRHPPLAAATLLAHGTDLQKEKFLRRILTGEDTWCQLFSEPGSGSDLAGATTRAEFKGNRWVINGQKVWTTSAHQADWGLLLARTDWDVAEARGPAYFVIDIHQPGVEVQPLKQMNGHASFNQVFFTDAEVPAGDAGRRRRPTAGRWRPPR